MHLKKLMLTVSSVAFVLAQTISVAFANSEDELTEYYITHGETTIDSPVELPEINTFADIDRGVKFNTPEIFSIQKENTHAQLSLSDDSHENDISGEELDESPEGQNITKETYEADEDTALDNEAQVPADEGDDSSSYPPEPEPEVIECEAATPVTDTTEKPATIPKEEKAVDAEIPEEPVTQDTSGQEPVQQEEQTVPEIPEEPAIPETPEIPEDPETPEEVVQETLEEAIPEVPAPGQADDVTMLAKLIYHEARGECYEGKVAVGEVVMNRIRSGGFQSTVAGVAMSGAFTDFNPDTTPAPSQELLDIAAQCINGTNPDIIEDDVCYFKNPYMCGVDPQADWGRHRFSVNIGNHSFYHM